MKLIGNKPIKIIQGDSYEYKIKFSQEINTLIEKIYLTSEDLTISSEMEFDEVNEVWSFKFLPTKTNVEPSDYYTYDITIKFKDGDVLSETGINLTISTKQNPVENILGE